MKTLKELELSIPSIDLLDTRKLLGESGYLSGYDSFDDTFSGGEFDDLIVTPDPGPDPEDRNPGIIYGMK